MIQNNQLVYRKRSKDNLTIMEEDLRLCTVKPAYEIDRRYCFEVVSPSRYTHTHTHTHSLTRNCKWFLVFLSVLIYWKFSFSSQEIEIPFCRSHMLQGDSEQECQLWITAIQAGVSQAYRDSPHKDEVNIFPLSFIRLLLKCWKFLENTSFIPTRYFCQEFCC